MQTPCGVESRGPAGPVAAVGRHYHNMDPGGDLAATAVPNTGNGPLDFFCVKDGVHFAGTHVIIDLYGAKRLNEMDHVEATMRASVKAAKATLLGIDLHYFNPNGGISGVAVLAESHMSIHTWPECGYAALDIFTCGSSEPRNAVPVLEEAFKPEKVVVDVRLRGVTPPEAPWVEERLHDGFRARYRADKMLYETRSDMQHSIVFENKRLGNVLVIDDAIQTSEADEFVYHEMLAHVPIFAHGSVRNVLVVGGGDGGMIEEVLKHKDVESVTLVEIDRSVVDLSLQYLPKVHRGAFSDPRLKLVIADGYEFAGNAPAASFDVVIIDSCDPIGPASVLFCSEFYSRCRRVLTPGGILVTQCGTPFWQGPELTKGYQNMKAAGFTDASAYLGAVPLYAGGFMSFGWGCDDPKKRTVAEATIEARFAAAGLKDLQYYTPAVHCASFALPPFVGKLLHD